MISQDDFQKNELEKIATFKISFPATVESFHGFVSVLIIQEESRYRGLVISNLVQGQ